MNCVFADTQGWIALNNKRDQSHKSAVQVKKEVLDKGQFFVTTNYVLDETFTLLRLRVGHKHAVAFGDLLRRSKVVEIVHIDETLESEAWKTFKKFSDKTFSFTDCTSFVVMKKRAIDRAYTNDHHFEQMGFEALLT